MKQNIFLIFFIFNFSLISAQYDYDSPDLSVHIPDYDFVNFSNNYSDNRIKRFLRGDGLSALNRGAHPFYEIKDQTIVKHGSYYDIKIIYVGRLLDFSDTYRLYMNSYKTRITSIELIEDGNSFTPAFSLVEKAIELLDDNSKESSIMEKIGTTKNVIAVVTYILNNKFEEY